MSDMAGALRLYLALILILTVLFSGRMVLVEAEAGSVHTVFNVDCHNKFGFQTLGLLHSLKKVGQPGPITRLLSCAPEEIDALDKETMELVQTYITPSFAEDYETGDNYSPYNRPKALMMWMADINPPEEWILILDPDMVLRSPLTPSTLQIPEGFVSAAHCTYLTGCSNDLAERHIPEVPRLFDENAGVWGRRCDEVGAYILMHMEDMKRVAPLWWQYSQDVREDLEAWEYKKDAGNKDAKKPWIAEMYGYAFATAKLGLRHMISMDAQAYTPYDEEDLVVDVPKVLHYTYDLELLNYTFTKRNHSDFSYTKCPSDGFKIGDEYGLFPHPPHPSELVEKRPNERYLQLLGIELMGHLNGALCDRHQQECPFSAELARECKKVEDVQTAVKVEETIVEKSRSLCEPPFYGCGIFKMLGKCKTWHATMSSMCRSTCGLCMHEHENRVVQKHEDNEVEHMSSQIEGMLEMEHRVVEEIGGNHVWWLLLLPAAAVLLLFARKLRSIYLWAPKFPRFSPFNPVPPCNGRHQKVCSVWRLRTISRKQF